MLQGPQVTVVAEGADRGTEECCLFVRPRLFAMVN